MSIVETIDGFFDFWRRVFNKFTVLDIKLPQIYTATLALILAKAFPAILVVRHEAAALGLAVVHGVPRALDAAVVEHVLARTTTVRPTPQPEHARKRDGGEDGERASENGYQMNHGQSSPSPRPSQVMSFTSGE